MKKFDYLKRKTLYEPAYDKRDPDPKKNYGIHGLNMRFLLSGKLGTVQFLIYTNWQLPQVREEYDKFEKVSRFLCEPMAADIGYHSRVPQYEGQKFTARRKFIPKPWKKIKLGDEEITIPDFEIDQDLEPTPCEFLNGDACFYDGSSLNAEKYLDELVAYGDEALWKKMAGYYTNALGNEEHWLRHFWIFQEINFDQPQAWFYIYKHINGHWEKSALYPSKRAVIKAKLKTHYKIYLRKISKFISSKLYDHYAFTYSQGRPLYPYLPL